VPGKDIFYKKPVEQFAPEPGPGGYSLKRALGPFDLTMLGIGAIIGAGIFVITGQAAAQYAGPGIVISFMLSATACILAGLCYAEFASLIPAAGSAYTYAYAALGQIFAMIIGWDLVLEYLFAMSCVAVGWSGYAASFLKDFGIVIPAGVAATPFGFSQTAGWHWTGGLVNLPAVFIIVLLTALVAAGIRESAKANRVIVFIKMTAILLFIGFGIWYVSPQNWTPFIPENTGEFGSFGWSGILRGAGVVFFAYIGFDAVSTAAQEAKNPQRDMPIGIMASLVICTILYVAVSAVLTGMVHYSQLGTAAPVALALDRHPELAWLAGWIKLGAIAGMTSVMLVMLLGQPRIFYAMSRDGLLPPLFRKVHPKHRTPYIGTLITGVLAAVIGGLFPVTILGELVSIGTLLAFATVCIGVLVLRYTRPDLPRPFRVRAPWLVCVSGALICAGMMASLPHDTWLRLLVWTLLGFLIYVFYGYRHSELRKTGN
jgi:APA family basic amino acid/polyamine antiporter